MHNVPTATAEAAIDESVWDRAIKGKVSGSGRRGDASRPFWSANSGAAILCARRTGSSRANPFRTWPFKP